MNSRGDAAPHHQVVSMRPLSKRTIGGLWAVILTLSIILACGGSGDREDYSGGGTGGSSGGSTGGSGSGGTGSGGEVGDGTGNTTASDLKSRRDALFQASNDARNLEQDCGTNGIKPAVGSVLRSTSLDRAAQRHAEDMALNDFVSHVGSDGSSFLARASAEGNDGALGENVAAGHMTAGAVVNSWINSDSHCRNLMRDNAIHMGVGYAKGVAGSTHGHYWVQVFGR